MLGETSGCQKSQRAIRATGDIIKGCFKEEPNPTHSSPLFFLSFFFTKVKFLHILFLWSSLTHPLETHTREYFQRELGMKLIEFLFLKEMTTNSISTRKNNSVCQLLVLILHSNSSFSSPPKTSRQPRPSPSVSTWRCEGVAHLNQCTISPAFNSTWKSCEFFSFFPMWRCWRDECERLLSVYLHCQPTSRSWDPLGGHIRAAGQTEEALTGSTGGLTGPRPPGATARARSLAPSRWLRLASPLHHFSVRFPIRAKPWKLSAQPAALMVIMSYSANSKIETSFCVFNWE